MAAMAHTTAAATVRFLDLPGLPGVCAVRAEQVVTAFPRHVHAAWVLGVIDSGGRRIRLRGQDIAIPAGHLFLLPPGVSHACEPLRGPQSYRVLSIAPQVMRAAAAALAGPVAPAPRFPSVHLRDLDVLRAFAALFRLAEARGPDSDARRAQACGALLRHLICNHADLSALDGDGGGGALLSPPEVHAAVVRAKAHIEASLPGPVTLDALGRAAHCSPYHLQRLFLDQLGVTPTEYAMQQRVARARALIDAGCPLAEAALAAGFCDQSHFSRHFRRVVGVAPGRYRRGNEMA